MNALSLGCMAALVVACSSGNEPPANGDDGGVLDTAVDAPADVQAVEKKLVILSTTDLHARIMPFDYFSAVADEKVGLAKIASVVRKVRAENPCTLLIDSGDTIQGTPLGTLFAKSDGTPHPMAVAMNTIGYDAMALGNHEFNFGLPVLDKFISDAKFPVLAANVRKSSDGSEAFGSFVIREVCGVKVGILGAVVTLPKLVEPAMNVAGLRFDPIVPTLKEYAPKVRAAGADMVVVAVHSGPDRVPEDWSKPLPMSLAPDDTESAMLVIGERVPEVDVVLGGHSHRLVPKVTVGHAIAIEAGQYGERVGKVTVTVRDHAVVAKDAELVDPSAESIDSEVATASKDAHDGTIAWVDEKIGTTKAEFFGGQDGAYFVDSALADLVNAVQLEVAEAAGHKADLSTSFVSNVGLPAGDVKRRDVFAIYPFENTLAVVKMSGAALIDAIGYDGRIFDTVDPTSLPASASGLTWKDHDYNYDFFTHVEYSFDFTTPYDSTTPRGPRLASVKLGGAPIDESATFLIAVNSYRSRGSGNIGFAKGEIVWESPKSMREYLLDYFAAHPNLDPEVVNVCNFTSKPDLFTAYFTKKTKCSP